MTGPSSVTISTPGTCASGRPAATATAGRPTWAGSPGRTACPPTPHRPAASTWPAYRPPGIGVGSLDLFLDEDREYARRLRAAGVDCQLEVVDGAFHGFDALFLGKDVSRDFWRAQSRALEAALFPARAG